MHSTTLRRAVATVAALVLLCAALVRDAARPPAPVAATAPPADFSAERAMRHVRAIAERPHPIGSADNARVREYVLAELRALGLAPEVQEATGVGTRYPEAGHVRNILARLPGRTPGGPAVVLMAHYDGVGGGPAAGDDAAGTGAILETLRALRAGGALEHDVIALITDGEEAGLLGAAAFVREHPWAKDVGVALNFEARGTGGRSYMFETGPGNLDVVRVLRGAPDVSATSLSVTVYRTLPNDTDLSELAVLGTPALNFAFTDGVERYHTAHDDVAHLDAGSVQHHGAQALALARAFGNGPLPRPSTGDAVFFDVPLFGLLVYPEGWAMPLALAALALVLAAALRAAHRAERWGRDIVLGVVGTLAAVALGGGVAFAAGTLIDRVHAAMRWGGAPAFRGIYATAIAALAFASALACWAVIRRWAGVAGAQIGALVVWGVLALVATWKAPGVSFLFVWPLIAAAIAALVAARRSAAGASLTTGAPGRSDLVTSVPVSATATLWTATVVATVVLVPVVYAVSAVLLGVVGPGGIAVGVLVPLMAWLLAPQLEAIGAGRRGLAAAGALGLGVLLLASGMATVRSSPEHPTRSALVYAVDIDSGGAWLATNASHAQRGSWAASALGPDARTIASIPARSAAAPPAWLARLLGGPRALVSMPPSTFATNGPDAVVLSDSTWGDARHLLLRVRAPRGAEAISMRAERGRVLAATIDGRAIDTTRYRNRQAQWRLDYSAPPDSGVMLGMSLPAGGALTLELIALAPGLPSALPGPLPPRPADVVTSQSGDVTIVRRAMRF